MARPPRESVDPALAGIWARNLPATHDRLATLERAAASLAGGERVNRPEDAVEAAHKLAGSLGSFGLARGSELARELERRFEKGAERAETEEVTRLAAELRSVIEG